MFVLFLKRMVVFFMAITSIFSSGKGWADSCKGLDFPRIKAENQAAGTLRIMSFNIRCSDVNGVQVPDRKDIAVRQIKEVMPDVLGLQEVTPEWMKELVDTLDLYDWVGLEREQGRSPLDGGESCPVFYLKERYKKVDSGDFWLSDTPDVPSLGPGAGCKRICTWIKLKNRLTGQVFVHVNSHLDHISEDARVIGANVISRFIDEHFEGLPVFFTADMNTFVGCEAYNTLTAKMKDTRFTAKNVKTYGTYHDCDPAGHEDYYIDFVLASPGVKVKAYRTVTRGVDERFVSDHFPIYADVVIKEERGC